MSDHKQTLDEIETVLRKRGWLSAWQQLTAEHLELLLNVLESSMACASSMRYDNHVLKYGIGGEVFKNGDKVVVRGLDMAFVYEGPDLVGDGKVHLSIEGEDRTKRHHVVVALPGFLTHNPPRKE